MKEREEGVKMIIEGDFNAREKGRMSMEDKEEGKERERNSKDSKKQKKENIGKEDKGERR